MRIREAKKDDIDQIQIVRNSVKENTLSNPKLLTEKVYEDFLFKRGKGWVCEINNQIVGFSIVDLVEKNVWALFLLPDFEKRGIGKHLHDIILDWYFTQTKDIIWLGTTPKTRAETFYRTAGWIEAGMNGPKEIKFEMSYEDWEVARAQSYL
ncbi:acetyltransferase (GNAT) family protein [Gelidibacter algens]|uniref:Acetyltransferase (GNAT) family protein n=1 Tax=Gelidibacter algens TaxID=49280 RepID=A0A1A7QR09_9FLAO|nr:GNAT family N-acetyltransferase [Gelidibacter algens]OBX20977.1 GCN5 family acetyltransferase [Gelidibacter algens]RAJ25118.1 acetyltransferase (GNAT) family protein [Gelidibacter algens]